MKTKIRFSLFIVLIISVVLFAFHLVNSGKYVSERERFNTELGIKTLKREIEILNERKQYLKDKIAQTEFALNDLSVNYDDVLKEELLELEALSGKHDLYGPGIVIILKDGDRELDTGESANNVLVHDGDIQQIVHELRNAGAEAISVNDERVIMGTSDIVCVGPVILINQKHLAPPYIIRAIGDRKTLEATMNAPGSYLDLLKGYGLRIEVNTSKYIEIKKLGGLILK
ncbi:MAG: DUF881 domain-containing protein [Bacillota bacterium]|nr:DUF881 domain-containing protein [Bacillota bacterium]